MSLETLLEAAKYLEYRSEVKARGEEPHDYYTFTKLCSVNSGDFPSIHASQPSQSQKHPQSSSNSQVHNNEEVKEKRRSSSSTSRDSLSKEHGGSGTREVHNKLEKNRRAHLKECFEALKKQLPNMDDRKTSNLSILRGALRCIQVLKRKEREHEHDLEKLAREKIAFQQQLAALKKEISSQYDHIDVNALISVEENETTTTASECGGGSDFDDDYQSDVPTTSSNQNAQRPVSGKTSAPPLHAVNTVPRPVATNSAFPKHANTLSTSLPVGVKSGHVKSSPAESPTSSGLKHLPRMSSEVHGLHLVSPEEAANHSPRYVPASNLHAMAGIISPPHAVQVITPPSSIKLLTAGASVTSPTSVQPFSVSPHQQQQQHHGQIHVLASNLPYVTTAASKLAPPDHLVQVTDLSMQSSKQQASSPVALVTSKGFVGVTQMGTTVAQPVIVNQTSGISELMSSSASSLPPDSGFVKVPSSGLGTTIALTVKNSPVGQNSIDGSSSYSISNTSVNAAKSGQAMQNQPSSQAVSSLVPSEGLQLTSTSRQTASSSARQQHSTPSSACTLLSHGSSMTQFTSPSPITVPASHLVGPGGHISGVSPFVGSVSVVSHTGALHHHPQVLAQSQPIGKVLASPILKSFNQIPIIQQQFLQAPGAVSSQHIVKPVVVVSMPNIIHSSSISPLASRHANDQPEVLCSPSQGSQK